MLKINDNSFFSGAAGLIRIGGSALASIKYSKRYLGDIRKFKAAGGRVSQCRPIFSDYKDNAGTAKGHYFHQDLLVANFIFQNRPVRHLDVGSRIDGFVAHVAAFREIEVVDVRPLGASDILNIKFLQADLMNEENAPENITDSISCLHALEHFGLGRYGDPIDPLGHVKGFNNLIKMTSPGGIIYISFPVGKKNSVVFNAHRVFHPVDIFSWAGAEKLELVRYDHVDDGGNLYKSVNIHEFSINDQYGCGVYTFRKLGGQRP